MMSALTGVLAAICVLAIGVQGTVSVSRNKRSLGGYSMVNNGKAYTHAGAVKACKDAGGSLATPRVQHQLDSLTATGFPNYAWLDINDVKKEGSWVYPDGKALTFTSWGASEPNNVNNEDCAITPSSGKWLDVPCDVAYGSAVCWFNNLEVPSNYVAEVLFVVDSQFVKKYESFGYSNSDAKAQIKGDLKYYVFEINKKFQTLTSVNIDVRIKHISFPSSALFYSSDVSSGAVNSNDAFKRLRSYLTNNNVHSYYSYDVAFLLTGYSFENGYTFNAFINNACSIKSGTGVISFDGTYGMAKAISQGLGQLLGDNGCTKNNWKFSSCSDKKILKYMNSLSNNNCLQSTSTSKSTYTFNDFKNRDIVDKDKACKRAMKDSTAYYSSQFTKNVCATLWCGKAGTGTAYTASSSEGFTCGSNKRCSRGSCIATPSG